MSQDMQNNIEHLRDQIQKGALTVEQANVEMVRMERVRLIIGPLRIDVRCALNAAVKRGELGHMKKDGLKPECYYHPTFDYLAHDERNKKARQGIQSLATAYGVTMPQQPGDSQ